jgi:hypothetical protein
MSKLRIHGALYMFALFAAVAVFANVTNVGSLNSGKLNVVPSCNVDKGILTADGGDPYPIPPPKPVSPSVAS